MCLLDPCLGLPQLGHNDRLELRIPQICFEERSGFRVVFHNQHRRAMKFRSGREVRRIARVQLRRRRRSESRRKTSTLCPGFALQPQPSAQQHRQIAAQRQAQAGAAMPLLQRILDLAELAGRWFRDAPAGCRCRCLSPRKQHQSLPTALAHNRTRPSGVNFSAFEIRLRTICETLPSSVCKGPATRLGSSKISSTGVVVRQQRLQHALERAEQLMHLETLGANLDLAGLHLRQIEQVVHHLLQDRAPRIRCSGPASPASELSSPSILSISSRASEMMEFSGVRNSCETLERNLVFRSEARRK